MKLSEDPNNTTWANDKSRFGFLMLKKMGWSEGVGLGKNEQGVVEAIKVKKRKEAEGIPPLQPPSFALFEVVVSI